MTGPTWRTRDLTLLVHHDRPALFLDLIAARFPDLGIATCASYDALPAAVADAKPDILLCYKFEGRAYPRAAALAHPGTRWVHNGGTGVDHLVPWNPDEVTVTNSAGIMAPVLAEYTLAAILALNLRFPAFMRAQAAHAWQPQDVRHTRGQTLCIVGLGHIGQAIARLARAAGLTVIGVRRSGRPLDGIAPVYPVSALREAVAQADHTVVAVPLTPETRGLIGAEEITAMKPGATLVNIARGGVVEERPLIDALRSGHLGGAVLDVFATEPLPPESPFWTLPNVIVTPHSSSVFAGWERAAAEVFCDNLERYLAGQPLENVVDPSRGY